MTIYVISVIIFTFFFIFLNFWFFIWKVLFIDMSFRYQLVRLYRHVKLFVSFSDIIFLMLDLFLHAATFENWCVLITFEKSKSSSSVSHGFFHVWDIALAPRLASTDRTGKKRSLQLYNQQVSFAIGLSELYASLLGKF